MKLAWVTSEKYRQLIPSEREVVANLREHGVTVEAVIWDQSDVEWDHFDLIIIRTTWDYHLKTKSFMAWIDYLQSTGLRVLNDPKLVKWNHHKFYLQDIQDKGIRIVPTSFVQKNEDIDELDNLGDELIIKPAISATASGLRKVNKKEVSTRSIQEFLSQGDYLLQPYQPEIKEKGEWSFVFLNNRYSHAVLKKPAKNDFRVQNDFGGSVTFEKPNNILLNQVLEVWDRLGLECLYARVDGIEIDGLFHMMELELIEPDLFLYNQELIRRFAKDIKHQMLKKSS